MSTPLLLRRNQNSDQKYAQETNAMAIEEDKPKPDQARHARDGINKLLTDIQTVQRRNHPQVFSETIAETHQMVKLFGAILLTRIRDGNIVIQSAARKTPKIRMTVRVTVRLPKLAQARDALVTVDTKSRQEPDIPV
jgi:hypothetical protein